MGMNKTAAIRATAESPVYRSVVMKIDSYLSLDPLLLSLLLPTAESQLLHSLCIPLPNSKSLPPSHGETESLQLHCEVTFF